MRITRLLGIVGVGICIAGAVSFVSIAAQNGWVTEGGAIRYVDGSGNYVRNAWRDSDGKRYYLDEDGKAAEDTWVDSLYYVDKDGLTVKNAWRYEDGSNREKEEGWYYLGKNGKVEADGWRTIDGEKYSFDKNGKMRTGWHYENGDIYYLGNEGNAKKGWLCLEYDGKNPPKEGRLSEGYEDGAEGGSWFYFQATGKAKRSLSGDYEPVTIDGRKYYFDSNGVMLTGWHAVRATAQPGDKMGISRFVYLGGKEEGIVKKQWLELKEHPANSEDGKNLLLSSGTAYSGPKKGRSAWYYFGSDGAPEVLDSEENTISRAVTKIDGQFYLFDAYGCLQTGLVRLGGQVGYFGESQDDAFMHTGMVKEIKDKSGTVRDFCFGTTGSLKGVGVSGERDGFLYADGALVTAEAGKSYEVFKVGESVYLVNEAGRIQKENKAYYCPDGVHAYRIEGDVLYEADAKGNKGEKILAGRTAEKVSYDHVY